METPERAWTDPRIDDLKEKVGDGFAQVDKRFERVDKRFERLEKRMDAGFNRFDKKFDRLMWGLVAIGSGIIPALLGLIGSWIQSQIS